MFMDVSEVDGRYPQAPGIQQGRAVAGKSIGLERLHNHVVGLSGGRGLDTERTRPRPDAGTMLETKTVVSLE